MSSQTQDVINQPINFRLERETRGAVRYNEIRLDGRIVDSWGSEANIGTLYIKKGYFEKLGYRVVPRDISLVIQIEDTATLRSRSQGK